MERRSVSVILILLAVMLATNCPGAVIPRVNIPLLQGNIVADGQSNDSAWAGQAPIVFGENDIYLDYRSDPPDPVRLSCLFGRNTTNFHFYFTAKDKEIVSKPWSSWRMTDLVMICWGNGASERIALIKPTSEMRILTPGSGTLSPSTGTVLTTTSATGWTAEGSIPLTELGGVPPDGKLLFAVVQRDWNTGQNDYTCVGSGQKVVYASEGSLMWDPATVETTATPAVVAPMAVQTFPEGVLLRTDLLWSVTYADSGRFICEDSLTRIHALEVVYSGPDQPAVNDLVFSVVGKKVGKKMIAESVTCFSGHGTGLKLKPWGMTTRSIGPLNSNLLVKMTGKVKEATVTGFIMSEGNKDIAIVWSSCPTVGQPVMVTGVASSGGITAILATEVATVEAGQ